MPRAKKALASLPWVDQDSAKYDTKNHEVRFKLKDRSAWNEDAVRAAFKEHQFPEMSVKSLPPP